MCQKPAAFGRGLVQAENQATAPGHTTSTLHTTRAMTESTQLFVWRALHEADVYICRGFQLITHMQFQDPVQSLELAAYMLLSLHRNWLRVVCTRTCSWSVMSKLIVKYCCSDLFPGNACWLQLSTRPIWKQRVGVILSIATNTGCWSRIIRGCKCY